RLDRRSGRDLLPRDLPGGGQPGVRGGHGRSPGGAPALLRALTRPAASATARRAGENPLARRAGGDEHTAPGPGGAQVRRARKEDVRRLGLVIVSALVLGVAACGDSDAGAAASGV